MKKVLINLIAIVGGLCAVIALMLTAVSIVVFDESRFEKAYEKYDRYEFIGIAEEDLNEVTSELLMYMRGDREDLVMYAEIQGYDQMVFEEREQLHMVDVLNLFNIGFNIRNICALIAIGVILLLFAIDRKNLLKTLSIGYLIGFGIIFVLLVALGIGMLVDFSALFTKFHLLLFDNDLWLLDPDTDIMIQMFPEAFFNEMGIAIALYAVAFITIPAILAIVILLRRKRRTVNGV